MSADYLRRQLVSHSRQVCSLYKRMLRDIDWWEDNFLECRYKKVLLRAQFDKNKSIKDLRVAKELLERTKKQFDEDMHPIHKYGQPWHQFSKDGIAYGRMLESPDWVMDQYHPLFKAQYPYYYAKREQMKDEYIKMWKKKVLKEKVDEEEAEERAEEKASETRAS